MSRRRAWDWRQEHAVVQPQQKETISYTLWHRLLYTSGTTVVLDFFTVGANGINGNLDLNGQLPNGYSFRVEVIRFAPALPTRETALAAPAAGAANGAIEDMHQVIMTGHGEFRVGDKRYGRWPLFMLPAGGGVQPFMSNVGIGTADTMSQVTYATNGIPDPRSVYSLPIPIVIPPQYSFAFHVEWPAFVTTDGDQDFFIFTMLDGQLIRPAQ